MNKKTKAAQFLDDGYTINVTGRHVQITDSMRDYAMEKMLKIERLGSKIIDLNVLMDIQKLEHRCEIILKMGHLKMTSHATTDDMYASIDKAVDKMQAQIRKHKDRLQDHQRRPLSSIDMNVNVIRTPFYDEEFEINEKIEAESTRSLKDNWKPHEIVERQTMPLKMLNAGEALLKLELSGDVFLLYTSEEDRKLKLLYRRRDGNFAVIEPEV